MHVNQDDRHIIRGPEDIHWQKSVQKTNNKRAKVTRKSKQKS